MKYAEGKYLAIGEDSTTVFIMEIPKILIKAQKGEKAIVQGVFEREQKRLRSIETRDRKAEGGFDDKNETNKANQDTIVDEVMEKEYKEMEQKFMSSIS